MDFSKNLRRLRLSKNLTQEQVASALGVSAQSISRWECGTTLPDVTMLPAIAQLYCVTIDDLYRETSVVYANYAERLGSVFEASHQPEDFLQADIEYRKLLESGKYTVNDLRSYGILHQYMMQLCRDKALTLFDRALKMGPEQDDQTYWSTWRQKIFLLGEIGRGEESIRAFLPLVEAGSANLDEWICLIHACREHGQLEDAWHWAQKAAQKFPENAMLHIYNGDLCKAMGRYEEAFAHWQRAREMEPTWMDSWYSMGFCYEELEDYANAYQMWTAIADHLTVRGFEAEVNWPRERARHCLEKMK